MAKKNQHVVPEGKVWGVRGEGNRRLTRITKKQQEPIEIARQIAKNQRSELFIHNREGEFRDRNSYGNDPYPPKG